MPKIAFSIEYTEDEMSKVIENLIVTFATSLQKQAESITKNPAFKQGFNEVAKAYGQQPQGRPTPTPMPGVPCPACNKLFPSGRDLHEHIAESHADMMKPSRNEQFKCHPCNKDFKSATELTDHMEEHKKSTITDSDKQPEKSEQPEQSEASEPEASESEAEVTEPEPEATEPIYSGKDRNVVQNTGDFPMEAMSKEELKK